MEDNLNELIKRRYNRISGIYELMDRMIKTQWRRDMLSEVSGNILEVGIGTGANLPFYSSSITSLTGVDFSKGMLAIAQEKLAHGSYPFSVELKEADIQALPFQDNTFDSIVSSCVFCSVPNPMKGLSELKRVCKPNGRIYMLEHMKSENKMVGLLMDIMNPLTVRLWGANINRETVKSIELSGLNVDTDVQLMGSVVRNLIVSPNKSAGK